MKKIKNNKEISLKNFLLMAEFAKTIANAEEIICLGVKINGLRITSENAFALSLFIKPSESVVVEFRNKSCEIIL